MLGSEINEIEKFYKLLYVTLEKEKEYYNIFMIFVDFTKTFDRVKHHGY